MQKIFEITNKKFCYCINSIEDTVKIADLKVEELQNKLEAKEIRIDLYDEEDNEYQAMLAKGKAKKWSKGGL